MHPVRPFPNSDRHVASPHGVNHSTTHRFEFERIKARLWPKKRKSTVEALVPLPKRICLSGRHIRLSPQHDRSQHPLPEAQWG